MQLKRGRQFSWLIAFLLIISMALPAVAGELNLVYEQVVKDSYGNAIGYRTTRINSINDLPSGSPWRDYLNQKLPDGKTIYEYVKNTAPYLSKPLNFTISDRSSVSFSSKDYYGYNLNIYEYVTRFSNNESKTFLFLHEFGHVAMLNSYPPNYDFVGLDYGTDNRHYIDEILPNANTAWVEGWANAFAANRNNGKVFTLDMNSSSIVSFLQNNSFEEMSRNELFVGKIVYDSFSRISSGKDKAFNTIAKTGPHYSLKDFCRGFSSLYPADKAALAKLLVDNSSGKISLNEILDYVNGGSRTVSRDLYNYLVSAGKIKSSTTQTSSTSSQTSSSSGSIWNRIFGWFSGLFNRSNSSPVAAAPAASVEISNADVAAPASVPAGATAPELPGGQLDSSILSINDLATAQEAYYKAFAEYNRLLAAKGQQNQEVKNAMFKLQQAKAKVKELREQLRR
ncbi:MAG: hypothetical protein AB1403_13555 [Candidatus Riflebacteria bacterium]